MRKPKTLLLGLCICIASVLVLVACEDTANESGNSLPPIPVGRFQDQFTILTITDAPYPDGVEIHAEQFIVFHDNRREVTCWLAFYDGYSAGGVGLDCVPDHQLEPPPTSEY